MRLILKAGLCAQYPSIYYNYGAFFMEPMPYETHFGKGFILESTQNETNMQPAKEKLCSASNISDQSNATWVLEFASLMLQENYSSFHIRGNPIES